MKVFIVESPAKAATIKGFLGKDYTIMATIGHIKDLPHNKLGVDVKKKFAPSYTTLKGKRKVITQLKKLIQSKPEKIYLATDLDREGEHIAYQVACIMQELKLNKNTKETVGKIEKTGIFERITYNEITKSAILDAISNPRKLDVTLIEAQQTRRILDRLVGFELSELLWKKIRYGLSAGRVQSVALRLIVEKEDERKNFKSKTYYIAEGLYQNIKFTVVNNPKKRVEFKTKADIEKSIGLKIKGTVDRISTTPKSVSPPPPLNTAMLQQAANSMFGYSAKRTMSIAQQLYQGIELKGKKRKGLITYMRTDSLNLSQKAIYAIRELITKQYGKQYLNKTIRQYKTKSKVAQEAHEAIRPTHFEIHPETIKPMSKELYNIYSLIYYRAIATQMTQLKYTQYEIYITNDSLQKLKLHMLGVVNKLNHQGFAKIMPAWQKRLQIQEKNTNIKQGQQITIKIDPKEVITKPPARYTDASLVKKMEALGVGRPSTYANIIDTIIKRGYVIREKRYLIPTDNGEVVNSFLNKYFSQIVDYKFTAQMEDILDDIANGKAQRIEFLKEFYTPFHKEIEEKQESIKKEEVVILGKSDKKCPVCGSDMVVRLGRSGKFLSCIRFPECKGSLPIKEINVSKYEDPCVCKKCGGKFVIKKGKYGVFWACENYPKCKETKPAILKEKCPLCGKGLVERRSRYGKTFIGCSGYPQCKYIKKG